MTHKSDLPALSQLQQSGIAFEAFEVMERLFSEAAESRGHARVDEWIATIREAIGPRLKSASPRVRSDAAEVLTAYEAAAELLVILQSDRPVSHVRPNRQIGHSR